MDRGAWRATAHKVAKSQTQLKHLSTRARKPLSLWHPFMAVPENECNSVHPLMHMEESCADSKKGLQGRGCAFPFVFSALCRLKVGVMAETQQPF